MTTEFLERMAEEAQKDKALLAELNPYTRWIAPERVINEVRIIYMEADKIRLTGDRSDVEKMRAAFERALAKINKPKTIK